MATVNEKMTAIADAIRERTYGTKKLTLDDMAAEIPKVHNVGYQTGYNQGFSEGENEGQRIGYNNGYAEGYSSGESVGINVGKQAMNDAWWVAQTNNYGRTDYHYGFAFVDFSKVGGFNPQGQIKPKGASQRIFWCAKGLGEITADKLDLSELTSFDYMFASSDVTRVEEIDTSKSSTINSLFNECDSIVTIDKIILKSDGTQSISRYSFNAATDLTNITFEGKIGCDIYFTYCGRLTEASVESIFKALVNYAGDGKTHTVDLHINVINRLPDSIKAIATQKGWTIA